LYFTLIQSLQKKMSFLIQIFQNKKKQNANNFTVLKNKKEKLLPSLKLCLWCEKPALFNTIIDRIATTSTKNYTKRNPRTLLNQKSTQVYLSKKKTFFYFQKLRMLFWRTELWGIKTKISLKNISITAEKDRMLFFFLKSNVDFLFNFSFFQVVSLSNKKSIDRLRLFYVFQKNCLRYKDKNALYNKHLRGIPFIKTENTFSMKIYYSEKYKTTLLTSTSTCINKNYY